MQMIVNSQPHVKIRHSTSEKDMVSNTCPQLQEPLALSVSSFSFQLKDFHEIRFEKENWSFKNYDCDRKRKLNIPRNI